MKSRINDIHSYILLPFHPQLWTIYLLGSQSQIYLVVLERAKLWNDHFKVLFSKQCFVWWSPSPSLPQKMFSHKTCTLDSDMEASKLQPRPRTLSQSKNTSSEFIKQTAAFNVFSTLPDNSKAMPPHFSHFFPPAEIKCSDRKQRRTWVHFSSQLCVTVHHRVESRQ